MSSLKIVSAVSLFCQEHASERQAHHRLLHLPKKHKFTTFWKKKGVQSAKWFFPFWFRNQIYVDLLRIHFTEMRYEKLVLGLEIVGAVKIIRMIKTKKNH